MYVSAISFNRISHAASGTARQATRAACMDCRSSDLHAHHEKSKVEGEADVIFSSFEACQQRHEMRPG